MAYSNFKPTVWSKHILRELERECQLYDFCWKQYEGEAKMGEKVKILGVGAPTIGTYTGASIGAPETVADQSTYLAIDQYKYFNFAVDDVDKAQAVDGLMEAILSEAVRALAINKDEYIGGLAAGADVYATATSSANTAAKCFALVDAGLIWLRKNNVKPSDDVVIEVPPFFYYRFKEYLTALKTDNTEMIKKGVVGMYDGCLVRVTNNLYNDGTDDYVMLRSKKAIAAASGIEQTEAFRPETLFSDAIKGLHCYGAKVIRPKELYVIKAHNS
jgi:hypothetical protein